MGDDTSCSHFTESKALVYCDLQNKQLKKDTVPKDFMLMSSIISLILLQGSAARYSTVEALDLGSMVLSLKPSIRWANVGRHRVWQPVRQKLAIWPVSS